MVRIRVRIGVHDSVSNKSRIWDSLAKCDAYVYKILETKEAFILVTDAAQMQKIVAPENKPHFILHGLEVQVPPEYNSEKTLIIRGVDPYLIDQTDQEIKSQTKKNGNFKAIDKIIHIPSNPRMLKIIFEHPSTVEMALKHGLFIGYQHFSMDSLEKEKFVHLRVCMRCYSYEHNTKDCTFPETYLVCSECAERGHRFRECSKNFKKCLNCNENHRTLALRCKVRKEKVKEIEKKKKEKSQKQTAPQTQTGSTVNVPLVDLYKNMPNNFAAVIASALTLGDMREKVTPGSFQYTVDQIFMANGIPKVIFPPTVTKKKKESPRPEPKKRGRQEEEEEEEDESDELISGAVALSQFDLDIGSTSSLLTLPPTLTGAPTPMTSPERVTVTKKPPPAEQKKKKTKPHKESPDVVIIAPNNMSFTDSTTADIYDELKVGKYLKYIYQNNTYRRDQVEKMIRHKEIEVKSSEIYYVEIERFKKIVNGSFLKLQGKRK